MFQGWRFSTVDTSNTARMKYRQAVEAEFASMEEVWREHVENFLT
jgi:hypothetical protein